VDVRGSAPGTRETDLLRPGSLVRQVHAVLLTGGSAFGLDAAGGVMKYLESRGVGFNTGVAKVPIVPAAVIFDLGLGDARVRPDASMGEQACLAAGYGPIELGNAGAGTGATVGKIFGMPYAMKGGVGSASLVLGNGATVGALVVVNAFGDVFDPATGRILAGAINPATGAFAHTAHVMTQGMGSGDLAGCSTTIGVVATDAALDKEGTTKVAQMAHDGLARTINPVHTMYDGDAIFCVSTGSIAVDTSLVGTAAAEVVARAVVAAVLCAKSIGNTRCAGDFLDTGDVEEEERRHPA
jgi:L-aminopeptidase/D-esterase-like protein